MKMNEIKKTELYEFWNEMFDLEATNVNQLIALQEVMFKGAAMLTEMVREKQKNESEE